MRQRPVIVGGGVDRHFDHAFDIAIRRLEAADVQAQTPRHRRAHLFLRFPLSSKRLWLVFRARLPVEHESRGPSSARSNRPAGSGQRREVLRASLCSNGRSNGSQASPSARGYTFSAHGLPWFFNRIDRPRVRASPRVGASGFLIPNFESMLDAL
jgi:hypothetical protein